MKQRQYLLSLSSRIKTLESANESNWEKIQKAIEANKKKKKKQSDSSIGAKIAREALELQGN